MLSFEVSMSCACYMRTMSCDMKVAEVQNCYMSRGGGSLGKMSDSVMGTSLIGYSCVVTLGKLITPVYHPALAV